MLSASDLHLSGSSNLKQIIPNADDMLSESLNQKTV